MKCYSYHPAVLKLKHGQYQQTNIGQQPEQPLYL